MGNSTPTYLFSRSLKTSEMPKVDYIKKVVWLASYPKSGNTWFRAFLTALKYQPKHRVDINNMFPTTIASNRDLFDNIAGVPSSDLTSNEIDNLRPLVYRQNALESTDLIFHKIHDAWKLLNNGIAMFPEDITKTVIYFIRNPLDVVVSFSHHLSINIDKTIDIMNDPDYAFCHQKNRLHNQLKQNLNTWSGHVKSWVDNSGLPVLVIRYEDMKTDPVSTFSQAVSLIELNVSPTQIEIAIEKSSFNKLKQQEGEYGFSEKNIKADSFFRKGEVGNWKTVLSPIQVKRIVNEHHVMMSRFGYL